MVVGYWGKKKKSPKTKKWAKYVLPHCLQLEKNTGDGLFKIRIYCLVFHLWSLCDTNSCLHACRAYWILLIGDEILLFQFQTQMWLSHLLLQCANFASRLVFHTPGTSHHQTPDVLCKIQYGHETFKNVWI